MTDNTLILDPEFKTFLGEAPSFIYIDPIDFLLGYRDVEIIREDIDDDKIRVLLKSYHGTIIRWQNNFSSYYYFEFHAIRCIKYLCSFLSKNKINKCLFHTGVPHHFDSIFWSIACTINDVCQYYLVPSSISQGHFLFEQRGDISTRKLVKVKKKVDENHIEEVIYQLNKLSKFSSPISAATISRKSKSYIYAIYYLVMTHLKQSLVESKNSKAQRVLSFGTYKPSIWFDLVQINRQRKYLSFYDSRSYSGDIEDNSIIYFAHYQPEANVDPEVGNFANQLSNLEKLCNLYPDKKIYYKEHPGTWCYTLNRIGLTRVGLTRDLQYAKFLEKRITILDKNYKFNEALHHNKSILFVTINGSIGLQRALQGLPTYLFYHGWFSYFFKSSIKNLSVECFDHNLFNEKDLDKNAVANQVLQSILKIGTNIGLDKTGAMKILENDGILLREFLLNVGD